MFSLLGSEIRRIQQETEEQLDKERSEHEKELEFQHSRYATLQAEHDSRKEQIDKLDSTLLQKDLETEKIKTDLIKLKHRHKVRGFQILKNMFFR